MAVSKTSKLIRLLSVIISAIFSSAHAADDDLKIGNPAPEFSLYDQNNQLHSLKDYRGQWLVVYFYPKDDTPGCTQEACNFRDDILVIRQLNAGVLGISIDDTDSHKAFAQKYSLPFPLLADSKGQVARKYGALFSIGPIKFAKRHSFIINPEGLIAQLYRDVDPQTHSQEIIDAITALVKSTK